MSLSHEELVFLANKGLSVDDIVAFSAIRSAKPVRSSGAERQARYRARMDVDEYEWQDLRREVFQRDNFTCQYCGAEELLNPHCDHVTPLILGGSSVLTNLVCACATCNCGKSGMTLEQWRNS